MGKHLRCRNMSHRLELSCSLVLCLLLITIAVSLRTVSAVSCNPVPHTSIQISSDSDFTAANGVVSGTGTATDPYVIGNLAINDLTAGYGIKIVNSPGPTISKFFKIQCVQSNFASTPATGSTFIWIVGIHTATVISGISGNSQDAFGVTGVKIDSSSNIVLYSLSLNRIGEDALVVTSSDHITITNSKLKADGNGLALINSYDITVGSKCNLASGAGCNEFTYDDEKGILILNSHYVLVQYTITSADDSGGVLLTGSETYNVQLTSGTATGNGPICRTVNGARTPTGLKTDTLGGVVITDGAHDITVQGYTIRANTHYDIMNGGNGVYLNPCNGPQPVTQSTPGGSNLYLNGNCYGTEFGFSPAPTKNCPKS